MSVSHLDISRGLDIAIHLAEPCEHIGMRDMDVAFHGSYSAGQVNDSERVFVMWKL